MVGAIKQMYNLNLKIMDVKFEEFRRYTFDSATAYQKYDNVEEKVCKWTLLGNNSLMYETFDHTEPNENTEDLGVLYPEKHIIKISKELYDLWVDFLKTCCLHGDRFPNGDFRSLYKH